MPLLPSAQKPTTEKMEPPPFLRTLGGATKAITMLSRRTKCLFPPAGVDSRIIFPAFWRNSISTFAKEFNVHSFHRWHLSFEQHQSLTSPSMIDNGKEKWFQCAR